MVVTIKNPILMNILTDRELIEALQYEKTKDEVNSLMTQFFNRYSGYVYKVAFQKCRNFNDAVDLANDIVQETFRSILESKNKFAFPANTPDNECPYVVKGWLGRIANNCFNKEYARKLNTDSIDEIFSCLTEPCFDIFNSLYEDPGIEVPNHFQTKLQEALNSIKKDRDKHILLTYAHEGCIDSNKHLTPNAMEYLCKLYDTTSDNIRQIKKRTLDKVKLICFPANNS